MLLRQGEQERVWRVQAAEANVGTASAAEVEDHAVDAVAEREELLDEPQLMHDLERPRVDPDRPGLARARGLLVQHAHVDPAPSQLDRQHHPCRSRADDHHRPAVTAERWDQWKVFTRDRIGKHYQPPFAFVCHPVRTRAQSGSRPEQPGLHSAAGRPALDGEVEGATMQRLWEATRGNALFLRELVSQGLERGTLSADTGVWRWTADPSQPRTAPPSPKSCATASRQRNRAPRRGGAIKGNRSRHRRQRHPAWLELRSCCLGRTARRSNEPTRLT